MTIAKKFLPRPVSSPILTKKAIPLAAFPRRLRRKGQLVPVDDMEVVDKWLSDCDVPRFVVDADTPMPNVASTPIVSRKDDNNNNNDDGVNNIASVSLASIDAENYLGRQKDEDDNEYFIIVDPPEQEQQEQHEQHSTTPSQTERCRGLDLSSIADTIKSPRNNAETMLSPWRDSPPTVPVSVVTPFVSSSIKQNVTLTTYSPGVKGGGGGIDGDDDLPPWRQLLAGLKLLLHNPVFVLISLSLAADLFLLNGFAAFMPKFLQHQFSLTASYAAMLLGGTLVVSITLGVLLGGVSVRYRQLSIDGMLMQNIFMGFLCCWFLGVMWIRCEKRHLVGVGESGGGNAGGSDDDQLTVRLENACNRKCACPRQYYEPVCDPVERVQYFSACHAGCKKETRQYDRGGYITVYEDCGCLQRANSNGRSGKFEKKLVAGPCDPPHCPMMWVAIAGMFLFLFCHSLCTVPATEIVINCVPEEINAVALAVHRNVGFLLGSILSPFIFGVVIDSICVLWQTSPCKDGYKGACWMYDNDSFALVMFALGLGAKVLSVHFQSVALAYRIYSRFVRPNVWPGHRTDVSSDVVSNCRA